MHGNRDLCWLSKKVHEEGIVTYFINNSVNTVTERTIQREMPLLFHGITSTDKPEASVVFSKGDKSVLGDEGYRIEKTEVGYVILGGSDSGFLYGMFALHRTLLAGKKGSFPLESIPNQSLRMINHWDNFDGSIERGYAGDSIFYENNHFRGNYGQVREYARLLASIGINGISINNVNVHKKETFFIQEQALEEIKKLSDLFLEYGIRTFLSINYAAPVLVGNLDSADPLSKEVADWWKEIAARIYRIIPEFGGLLVKADSEGEPGPFTYGRSHSEGANMLAEALQPYDGLVIWRCFVYNCKQDWRDRNLDRARAAYDIFMEQDGSFLDNVILQIKNGPIDFQVREPSSPLFGALKKTNQILEFQITQEYTGHQKDICYLIPMWKETLDFDTGYGDASQIKHVIKDHSPVRNHSGIAAVGNVGMDSNWTGNKLAQANLYGYGRLIWDNQLMSEEIAKEWVCLSFDLPESEAAKIESILVTSRETYENYTCPLSVGFMCKPNIHYGVDIDGYEYDRWGTYHYADREGVGRDRTKKTGTGFTRQYSDVHFKEYENLSTCPDEFLLFFHHVSYTHVLQSGKTVIQHIYDTHFQGLSKVLEYQKIWESLKDYLDQETYVNVRDRLEEQKKNATDWCDQVNTYFYRKSGIPDEQGRIIYD